MISLAVLLDEAGKILLKQELSKSCESKWFTRVPQTPQEMQSLYIKGKDALIPNSPRPTVQLLQEHAYVSLQDCVADLLEHGFDVDNIAEVGMDHVEEVSQIGLYSQGIYHKGKEVHGNDSFVCLYNTEWSDGFDLPISTKANRGSCWIKSAMISPTHSAMHKLMHTYPSFYHVRLKRNITVYLELLVSLQDQSERRSANYIMLGSSRYTARWGVALELAAVASNIPSCKKGFEHLLLGLPDEATICNCCTSWETDRTENVLLHYSPPNDYPTEELTSAGKLTS